MSIAMNKSKLAVGLLVVGTLTVVFGTVLVFVGPIIIDNQIVKVSGDSIKILFLPIGF